MSTAANVVFILAGLFSLAGAVFDWDWFMGSRRAGLIVRILSRTGARIFYGLLGLVLIGLGAAGFLGLIG